MKNISRIRKAALLAVFPLCTFAVAQNAPSWTVRPEWVRAHEEFLASDALAGRGSATRDEQIAASYVASEFIGYGLKPAPGMTSYIQSAEVASPQLDGHATLDVGGTKLVEGMDFTLLLSSGKSVSEHLVHAPANGTAPKSPTRNAVLVVTDKPVSMTSDRAVRSLYSAGAAVILVEEDKSTSDMYTMFGGATRVPVRLAETRESQGSRTVIALTHEAMQKVQNAGEGIPVSLEIHPKKDAPKRFTYNAIGYLPGSDPSAGTLLLTAHLDHLGIGKPVNGDSIFNGANDDAAGTTAVLELAHALAAGAKLKRSVLFVCYGSEEAGELGSTYFGEHPPVPLKDLVVNLEFEMIGNQDPKMPKDTLLLTGWERSNLGPTLKEHGALLGPDPYPEQHYFERSDNYALALKGVVAHTAAGWGDPPTYHQPSDDLQHLDLNFMTTAIQSLVEPVRWLASSNFKPTWNPGGKPGK